MNLNKCSHPSFTATKGHQLKYVHIRTHLLAGYYETILQLQSRYVLLCGTHFLIQLLPKKILIRLKQFWQVIFGIFCFNMKNNLLLPPRNYKLLLMMHYPSILIYFFLTNVSVKIMADASTECSFSGTLTLFVIRDWEAQQVRIHTFSD